MELNLQTPYNSYSNTELLKIVRQEHLYRPEAIAIAKAILSDRTIHDEDVEAVNRYLAQLQQIELANLQREERVKKNVLDFLQPLLRPTEKIAATKWLRLFLVFAGLFYLWFLVEKIQFAYRYFHYDWEIDITFYVTIVSIIYVPVMFFLLYRQKKWGWILLLSDCIYVSVSNIGWAYLYFKYLDIGIGDPASAIIAILVRLALARFLWKKDICDLFDVGPTIKK